jgi:DNA adenine methylase
MSRNDDLLNAFNMMDESTEKGTTQIQRPPFGYAGSKLRSLHHILPMLPYTNTYVEPFGGSASVLLNRKPSKLEVFNDRYAGVVALYRCLRDPEMVEKLVTWMDLTVHSKEDFIFCRETWQDTNDPIERAGRWLYMMTYSFSGVGRQWGRSKSGSSSISNKLRNRIPQIWDVHHRFKGVQVENQHWRHCIDTYTNDSTVFYLDPPYLDTDRGCYRHWMEEKDHVEMLETVFDRPGFFAISGYPHHIYDKLKWDDRYEYDVLVTARGGNVSQPGQKRPCVKEVLWIKEN